MPIVAVGALGVVLAALLAALCIYGLALLARAVGNLAPDWHIPGLGNIRTAIINGASAALQATQGWLDQAVGPVADFLRAPFHLVRHLIDAAIATFQSIYNAINVVWGAIIYTVHLAQHLYNLALLQAAKWVNEAYRRAISWADHVYNLLHAEVGAVWNTAWRLFRDALNWADHLYNLALTQASKWVLQYYRAAVSWADHLYNLLRADIRAAEARVTALAQHLYNLAVTDAARFAAKAEATAKAFATASVGELAHVLTTDIAHPVEQAWIDVRDDVAALGQILASDLPDVQALVKRLDIARVGDIATATGALAAVDVLVLRYLRDCGIPQCKSLHDLTRDLPNLFALAEGAGMLALLAAMVHDPAGAADEVDGIVRPIVTDTTDTFASVVGI